MNPLNRICLQVSSFILTAVSIVFTVLLWSQLPSPGWMKIIAGLAGFALELCKFSLFPMALLLLKNKQTVGSGAGLLFIGGLLFVVSIGASVAFLENGEQARQQQSVVFQERRTTITQLDDRIRIAQLSASKDVGGGYRQRGLDTLKNVEQWQEERLLLINNPVIESAGMIGLNETTRFYAWLLLAILIDGCAIVGWTILSKEQNQEPELSFLRTEESREVQTLLSKTEDAIKETVESMPVVSSEETINSSIKSKLVIVDRELIDRILKGEHGDRLTIRGLMAKEKIGYAKAKQVVDGLQNDGLVMNTDRGLMLASSQKNQQNLQYN